MKDTHTYGGVHETLVLAMSLIPKLSSNSGLNCATHFHTYALENSMHQSL